MKNIILLTLLFALSSCAGFVKRIHSQLDKAEGRKRISKQRSQDPYNMYRNSAKGDARPIQNPITYARANTASQKNMPPQTQRNYRPQRYRYKAKDFEDNGNQASLWAGEGKGNYLFTSNDRKIRGDIVIIEVHEMFKDEISNELKRAYPIKKKVTAAKPGEEKTDDKTEDNAEVATNETESDDGETKIYDKISSQVAEEISSDYLLLKGRKEVIFRKKKRYLEVQALVSRRDIFNGDRVSSKKLIEKKIFILR